MADITLKTAGSLQKGNYVIVDGIASVVAGVQTSRPGKHGHAKCRIEAVGIIDGKKRQVVVPGHDNMECPIIGKKNAQVLSIAGNVANVMDMETYETYDLIVPEELSGKVDSGDVVLYWQILNDKVMKQVMQKGGQ
jgi:translation initiation factor 5A